MVQDMCLYPVQVSCCLEDTHIDAQHESDLNLAYIVNELANTVTVYRMDFMNQTSYRLQVVSTLPNKASGKGMSASAILLSPDGCFLYVTNRDENHKDGDLIVWFSISACGTQIARAGELRCGFQHPRAAALVGMDGRYLVVGSCFENGVKIYSRNIESGALKEGEYLLDVTQPSCFLECSFA